MKTTLHYYKFNTKTQAAEYGALCEKLTTAGLKKFAFNSPWCYSKEFDMFWKKIEALGGQAIELEAKHLFDNQWNSTEVRLMDWAEVIFPNPDTKQGYWLEQTAEMREIRDSTLKCGFCGSQLPDEIATAFCNECLDSPYLKSGELGLTRMLPISSKAKRQPLTEAEMAERLPLYRQAQIHGKTAKGIERLAKARAVIDEKYENAVKSAITEHDGMVWLLEHGVQQSAIYYSHLRRFGFGWDHPVDPAVKPELIQQLSEFPFPYDIK
jgi:hypothetical protein